MVINLTKDLIGFFGIPGEYCFLTVGALKNKHSDESCTLSHSQSQVSISRHSTHRIANQLDAIQVESMNEGKKMMAGLLPLSKPRLSAG